MNTEPTQSDRDLAETFAVRVEEHSWAEAHYPSNEEAAEYAQWLANHRVAAVKSAEAELAALKSALQPLRDRIEDELRTGRPALLAMQWFRIEPIVKALGISAPTNQNPLP